MSIFDWDGRVGRARYFGTGVVLFALKHNLDRVVAAICGYPWSPFNYWIFVSPDGGIKAPSPDETIFYVVLLLFAMPFIFTGTAMTLQRLRDGGLPLWLVLLLYVPFLNVIFFFILAAIPSRQSFNGRLTPGARIARMIPHSEFGSAVFGVVLTGVLALLETTFRPSALDKYGWELFACIPFFLGLNSTMIYGFHRPRSLGKCLLVSVLSTALVGAVLFAGIILVPIALPLASVIALFGGFVGYALQKRPSFATNTLHVANRP